MVAVYEYELNSSVYADKFDDTDKPFLKLSISGEWGEDNEQKTTRKIKSKKADSG